MSSTNQQSFIREELVGRDNQVGRSRSLADATTGVVVGAVAGAELGGHTRQRTDTFKLGGENKRFHHQKIPLIAGDEAQEQEHT